MIVTVIVSFDAVVVREVERRCGGHCEVAERGREWCDGRRV